MSSLRQTLAHYNRSQEQVTQPTSADNLAQFDDRRDADLKALLSSIKPFAETPDAEESKAYTQLASLFKDYRTVSRSQLWGRNRSD